MGTFKDYGVAAVAIRGDCIVEAFLGKRVEIGEGVMGSSKKIFVVSSNYLEALHKESTKYSFELVGCGNFKTACRLLQGVSVGDLLGVTVVERELPDAKSSDGKAFLKFVKMLGDLQHEVRLNIILVQGSLQNEYRKEIKKWKNITCYCHANAEAITDSVLNSEAFGSLLLEENGMYRFEDEEGYVLSNEALKVINVGNYLSEYLLGVVADCIPYDTLERTCIHDEWHKKYVEANDGLLQKMREWYVGMQCEFDVSDYPEEVKTMVEADLDNVTFPERYILWSYLSHAGGEE